MAQGHHNRAAARTNRGDSHRQAITATNREAALKVEKLASAMGAQITGIDLAEGAFDAGLIAEIRAVWLDHHMIVIRGQNLSPARQLELAKAFGEPQIYPFLDGVDGIPEITAVLKREHERVNFGGVWHTDTSYNKVPPMATMLHAIEIPPIGGDTLFANQELAYRQLSDGLRATLDGLRVVCSASKKSIAATRSARIAEKGTDVKAESLVAVHPAVRTHPETGRRSLYVSPGHVVAFEGWSEAESQGLLEYLFAHQTSPEFQCRLSWGVGDIAIWDNRSTLHYPLNDYFGHRRLLHRVTLKGDVPERKSEAPMRKGKAPKQMGEAPKQRGDASNQKGEAPRRHKSSAARGRRVRAA